MTTPVNDTLAEDRHTIARRLKGCAQRRELPTWGEIEFAADAILDLLARNSPDSEGLAMAKQLAVALWEQHYQADAPQWKVNDDLVGVILQIDNMTCGLRERIQRYGVHTWDCDFNDSRGERPCNCGWATIEASLSSG